MIPVIETERVRLRAFREDDLDAFSSFYDDALSVRFGGGPQTREDVWRRIALHLGHWSLRGFGFFAVEHRAQGSFVGYCGLFRPEGWPENELGWGLRPEYRGQGLATEAAARVAAFAYRDLGWTTLISLIRPDNEPSSRVAERLGARPEREYEWRGKPVVLWRHPGPGGAPTHRDGDPAP